MPSSPFVVERVTSLHRDVDRVDCAGGSVFTLLRVPGFTFQAGDRLGCRVLPPTGPVARDVVLLYRGVTDRTDPDLVCAHGLTCRVRGAGLGPDADVRLGFYLPGGGA